jgi:hypothetical protein
MPLLPLRLQRWVARALHMQVVLVPLLLPLKMMKAMQTQKRRL